MSPPLSRTLAVPYVGHPGEMHTIRWLEWGDASNPNVVFCIHGLTRNAYDFDFLAERLSAQFRVIAVDMPGRGASEWLTHPEEYAIPAYLANLAALALHLKLTAVHWVGTSMGGMIGMVTAATQPAFIKSMVLNDVGAYIPAAAIARLRTYVGRLTNFPSRAAAEAMLREIYVPFGITREEHWRHLFEHSIQNLPDGSARLAYDPAIRLAVNANPEPEAVDMWNVWAGVTCPVLLVRGTESDVFTDETAMRMQASRPGVTLLEVPKVGHAPTLMNESEIEPVQEWILAHR